jgi:hypothetical protein
LMSPSPPPSISSTLLNLNLTLICAFLFVPPPWTFPLSLCGSCFLF